MTPLESLFATIDALRAAEDRGSTHWRGCEVVHPRCAVYLAADAARPMAARADAAERLAKAADWILDGPNAYHGSVVEMNEALAAWRAIEGKVTG